MVNAVDLTKMIEEAGIVSEQSCCSVPNKFSNNDVWKGNLPELAFKIEQAAIRECIAFIRNGSFLHDQAPPKLFANEVTSAMESELLITKQKMHQLLSDTDTRTCDVE